MALADAHRGMRRTSSLPLTEPFWLHGRGCAPANRLEPPQELAPLSGFEGGRPGCDSVARTYADLTQRSLQERDRGMNRLAAAGEFAGIAKIFERSPVAFHQRSIAAAAYLPGPLPFPWHHI